MGHRHVFWIAVIAVLLVALTVSGLVFARVRAGALREAWHVQIQGAGVGTLSDAVDWELIGQDAVAIRGVTGSLRIYGFDGQLRYDFKPSRGGSLASFNVAPDGGLYIGTTNNYLYAIAPDFTQRWAIHLTAARDWYVSCAVGSDGTIFALADRGHVYAVNADGTIRWHSTIAGVSAMGQPVLLPDDTILCRTKQLEVVAISPQGQEKWRTASGVAGTDEFVLSGVVVLCPRAVRQQLNAVAPNGHISYSLSTPIGVPLAAQQPLVAAVGDGTCYFTSEQPGGGCDLVFVDALGHELWRVQLKHAASSPVLLPDGRVACLLAPAWDQPGAGAPVFAPLLRLLQGGRDARLSVFNPYGTASVSGAANCMFSLTPLLVTPAGELLLLDEKGYIRAFKP